VSGASTLILDGYGLHLAQIKTFSFGAQAFETY
jgi:hypothetical protein